MQAILGQPAAIAPVEAPKKKRGSRKAWTKERFDLLCKALANNAKLFGASYTHALQPANVPRDAPDSGEWNGIAARIMNLVPEYAKLLEEKAELNKTEKSHNGGLDKFVYVNAKMTAFINQTGVLGPHKIPVDEAAGGLGIIARTAMTSVLVTYSEEHGLKHPEEKKYIRRDAALMTILSDADLEAIKIAKPKTEKKKKAKKATNRVQKEYPKTKRLIVNGQEEEHFNFDVIPSIVGRHILPIAPRHVTDAQRDQVQMVRQYLTSRTEARGKARKEVQESKKKAKQVQDIQKSVVPTQVMMLSVNPNYQPPAAVGGLPGAVPGVAFAAQ